MALCLLLLNIISLVCIYSALHQGGVLAREEVFHRQIMWIIVSWIALIFVSFINFRIFYDIAYVFFGFNLLLLIAVEAMGSAAMGAQRWLSLGGLNFQPSELCKVGTIFLMARLFSRQGVHGFWRAVMYPLAIVCIAALFIFKQPDLGTALVVMFLFFAIGMASRVRKIYFWALIIAGLCTFPFAWHTLKDYQKKRIIVFVNPEVDPLGAGYNIIQSKIAIGSGQVFGKGYLSGTQNQFNFMPERHTDFIFTVLAEEWGFIGAVSLLFIYWLFLSKVLDIATFAKDEFGRLLAVGMGSLFFIHVFVNMGMTLGILPVVGIPLIFMSYGGSNLLINSMLVGILVNISKQSRGL